MILVLLLMAAVWFGGGWMGAAREVRTTFIALIYVAVLGIQIAFPETHPLKLATGGSAAPWLILAGFAALFWGYRQVILRLRDRAGWER